MRSASCERMAALVRRQTERPAAAVREYAFAARLGPNPVGRRLAVYSTSG